MKTFILAIALVAMFLCTAANASFHQNYEQYLYNPNNPKFDVRHAYITGTVANGRAQGKVWEQDTQILAAIDITGTLYSVLRYTWYQDNYYNEQDGTFWSVQAWPRVLPNGDFAWAFQRIGAHIERPYRRIDQDGISESSSEYSIVWDDPLLFPTLLLPTLDATQVAPDDTAGCISWVDSNGDNALTECLTNRVRGELREYFLNLFVPGLPGQPGQEVKTVFTSTAKLPPASVTEGFTKYFNDDLELIQDPEATAAGVADYKVPMYRVPAPTRRSMDVPSIGGGTVVYDRHSLDRIVDNYRVQQE
jgi:hypothetical protein